MIADKKQRTTGNGQRARRAATRRGVTLIEMLVTVAILVLIMAVVAQVFQAATGAVSTAQAIQDLDGQLRRLESVIRSDLGGATARFTPAPNYPLGPFGLDPLQNRGYFEYGENEFADNQGEDSDDYLKFTAKAPAGQPFTGRIFLPPPIAFANMTAAQLQNYLSSQPITITSEYAEIIYFLRNGNLYRRVLLIAPERQSTITQSVNNTGYDLNGNAFAFQPSIFGMSVSWQGVNDLSARPSARGSGHPNGPTVVLNTLGDLTNRENRFAAPRFADDFLILGPPLVTGGPPNWTQGQDGLYDDVNDDNVPDLYPSLYPGVFSAGLVFAPNYQPNATAINLLAFPYIFPGAYSVPQQVANDQYGLIHSPTPSAVVAAAQVNFDQQPAVYLQNLNHNLLDLGDNLPLPGGTTQPYIQTWWGFPTWREMLSPFWNDPTVQVNVAFAQPNGLVPRTTANNGLLNGPSGNGIAANDANLLPAMNGTWRGNVQLYNDGWGGGTGFFPYPPGNAAQQALWQLWQFLSWEDELIMTNVRSFDVKAYDNSLANYADLGWGDDPRVTGPLVPQYLNTGTQAPFLGGNSDYTGNNVYPPRVQIQGQWWDYVNYTFAHEGRMPPLTTDQRYDAQYGPGTYALPLNNTYTGNVGDNNAGIVRLRRVWDSWSTEYSQAPATGQNVSINAFPAGPPFSPPIYPSYPPPYPAQLRAIQIQIRVADPTNQHVKSLTLRQDFTEKL